MHPTCTLLLLLLTALAAIPAENAFAERDSAIRHELVRVLPHDATIFTQGLALHGEQLLESGGLYGQSALHLRASAQGTLLRKHVLPPSDFAEGLAICNDEIHLLTWREQRAWVFDFTLRVKRQLRYAGEGWGLTCIDDELVRSDGSAGLAFLDPRDHRVLRRLTVRDGEDEVSQLNELEYARGWILANVWHRDEVALIDPRSGAVRGWLDLSALRLWLPPTAAQDPQDVLNGLAYDAGADLLYVTGKRWPALFVLRVHWPPSPSPAP